MFIKLRRLSRGGNFIKPGKATGWCRREAAWVAYLSPFCRSEKASTSFFSSAASNSASHFSR